ncbi:MAG: hypothetical protein HY423_12710 [Candidatus Lambdaproteobacteria bacterium]|nr:hypothetical protein [Candidatus Lambdaproteobacteria bacterium]
MEFLRTRKLLPSILATVDLFREVFQGTADYELFLTGGYEEEDDEGVAFEIRFIGPLAEFQAKYDHLVRKWSRVIPYRDQDRIALTWHLN